MRSYRVFLIGVALAAVCSLSHGQQTGEFTGTVADTSGAVIPDATVTATNAATQQARTTTSNQTGNYTLPYLTPGVYTLKAQKSGFKIDSEANIALTVGAVLRMDFKMQVGEVNAAG